MNTPTNAQKAALSEMERARYVAWLLRLKPDEIFPHGPELTEQGNQFLVDCVIAKLQQLAEEAQKVARAEQTPRFLWYRKTLQHCIDVMEGLDEPPQPNADGEYDSTKGFRRGVYLTGKERAK